MRLKKKWIIILPIIIALAVFVGLYYYFNKEDKNSFTISENKWIEKNLSTIIDFDIVNDYPIFGENGVFREFLKNFSEDTGFEFNIKPYLKETAPTSTGYRFRVLGGSEPLGDNDLLLQEDVYVLISKDEGRIDDLNTLGSKTIGILTGDSDDIVYYLKSYTNLKYKTYDSSDALFSDYDNGEIDTLIVPNTMYFDKTLKKAKYNVRYVFTQLNKKIVLTLADEDTSGKMNNIVKKYFNNWKEKKYISVYNKYLLNYYIGKSNINDKAKTEFLTRVYKYGYVENIPYETKEDGELVGISAAYINRMNRLAGQSDDLFEYVKYDSLDELKAAIDKGEVDIYFNNFDYESNLYTATISPFIERYVVLAKTKDNYVINSFESTKNKEVVIMNNNAVYNYFKDNSKAKLIPAESIKELLNNSDGRLIVVDKELYEYYKHSKFSSYEVLYESTITNQYKFMIKTDPANEVFMDVFNYIIGTNSYYNYRNSGLNSLNATMLEKTSFEELYIFLLSLALIVAIVFAVFYLLFKRTKKVKTIKKEERRKYIDILTSLKNRNYLNRNIKIWNESQKYPQAVIIIDLNNVKYVNDNYGHEQGDKLIVETASILINTQLENTEIIRSDGNEFLIYLVGYSEQQVSTYSKKLAKEFKSLPYGFGAAIGYSMILDEIKTIDDAINEATIEMKVDKEEYK